MIKIILSIKELIIHQVHNKNKEKIKIKKIFFLVDFKSAFFPTFSGKCKVHVYYLLFLLMEEMERTEISIQLQTPHSRPE